jgi:hypothetical protein
MNPLITSQFKGFFLSEIVSEFQLNDLISSVTVFYKKG